MLRRRTSSRLTVWLFAALLLAKGAVPFLATAAAQLHGKGVADVCPIYGVALPVVAAIDPHAAHHHRHAVNADQATRGAGSNDGDDGPVRHDTRGTDHCVLTALATFAADAGVAIPAPAAQSTAARDLASHDVLPIADAAARWAALLGHGPPLRS